MKKKTTAFHGIHFSSPKSRKRDCPWIPVVSVDTGGHVQVGPVDIAGLWESLLAANNMILLGLAVEQGPLCPVRRQARVQMKKRPGLACCIVDTVAWRFMFMLGAEAWSDKWRM